MIRYTGERVALLTQHGKESVLAPVLEPALGCRIERVSGFDTDLLGTFTRDTPRPGSQADAARAKARKGMELSGLPIGLASEGSFVPDPHTGLFPWNVELLCFIDDRHGFEVLAWADAPARSAHLQTGDWAALESFARQQDFPSHQLVLRPESQDDPRLCKGLADWGALREQFERCRGEAGNGEVFIEMDLRAFANPTRMKTIELAAQDLLRRLESRCPACALPGFGVVERLPGLPCEGCGLPTASYKAERWQCASCGEQRLKPRTDRLSAAARECGYCNP